MTIIDTFASTAGHQLARLCADERGATAIEYAMMASGIGAVLAGAVYTLGGTVKNLFTAVAGLFS